ncbi:hypothetical protein KV112_17465 [Mycolicibacter sp. MYC123]|uniref:Uncharacterized protein n=1 Tax=[Mycobacterium] zoologicum TaxID=2872311 RepID=A0ABU5YPZ6_9MYCO|nr:MULTISPECIES: hypothetical protein [unclassified Mycolicibacter]MEB3051504.1 hypothetical protein [Mycolicibacter sp. MYC123]MEB3064732.1 hypothetical protein [Mycolicibacter sp. MYC101]
MGSGLLSVVGTAALLVPGTGRGGSNHAAGGHTDGVDLLDAFGLVLAAATGLGSLAAGFELVGIMHAVSQIQAEWAGLFG